MSHATSKCTCSDKATQGFWYLRKPSRTARSKTDRVRRIEIATVRSTLVAAVDPRVGAAVALHKACEALVAPPLHVFSRGIAGIPECGERPASCLENSAEFRTMNQISSDRQSLIKSAMEADLRMRSSTALFP